MEEIKIDGIPTQDYGTPNSRTTYIGQSKTFTNKEDLNKAMKDKTFENCRKKLDKMCEEYAEQLLKELAYADLTTAYMNGFYDGEKKLKDKIREKIKELEEFQKQHKEGNWADIPIEDYDFDKINLLKELLEE